MVKFFKKEKRLKLSDEQKIALAENEIGRKINELGDFIESKKDWNLNDAYCCLRFQLENSIMPQLKKNARAMDLARQAYEALEIKEVE